MNLDRISKMYGHMSNKERAALAFRLGVAGDAEEVAKITASIPRKTYICPDLEFDDWCRGLSALAAECAVLYLRHELRISRAFCQTLTLLHQKSDEGGQEVADEFQLAHESLLAFDNAVETVCEKHGMSADIIRKVAGVDKRKIRIQGLETDHESQLRYIQKLSSFLPREKS